LFKYKQSRYGRVSDWAKTLNDVDSSVFLVGVIGLEGLYLNGFGPF